MKRDERPLVAAAEKLDSMLASYDRAAHALLKQKLDSRKNLAKAADLLNDVARAEEALSGEVGQLVAAIAAARDRQQKQAEEVQARALEVLARKDALEPLIQAFQALATEVGKLSDAEAAAGPGALDAMLEEVGKLGDRAKSFAEEAKEAGFDDMAAEGHTLREQLLNIQKNAQRRSKRENN